MPDIPDAIQTFIDAHSEYTLDGVEQPGQGSTNDVVFALRNDELVVLKLFWDKERKAREAFALKHWRNTDLVPELIWDDDPLLLIMGFVPGMYITEKLQNHTETEWGPACHALGRAAACLADIDVSTEDQNYIHEHFYDDVNTLEAYIEKIISLSRSIISKDSGFSNAFWKTNLDFIESQVPMLLKQPRILYHQDAANVHFDENEGIGFFDLEMCRLGCKAMQIGSMLRMLNLQPGAGAYFAKGWREFSGNALTQEDIKAAAAADYLLNWREISRYLSYDGTPGSGYDWASPADPQRYKQNIQTTADNLDLSTG